MTPSLHFNEPTYTEDGGVICGVPEYEPPGSLENWMEEKKNEALRRIK